MSMKRRIEALEVEHHRRVLARVAPPGRADELLALAIDFLHKPPAQQEAEMPGYTPAEWAEIRSWLPGLRRALCKHGQDLPYTGGEFSGLVSKRLNT